MADTMEERIGAVRAFNRFYTLRTGVLREGLLHSPYSLTEARLLFELAHRDNPTAARLARELGLDPGYLSRTLGRFEQNGLIERTRAENDGRQRPVRLTPAGKEAYALLEGRSRLEVAEMLADLGEGEQRRLIQAMQSIESILDRNLKFAQPFLLRPPEPGDLGWITHRHGFLYAREYGWDAGFEALVARIVAEFVTNHQPARERAWIAEMNGEIAGCVFLVQAEEAVAKLRLLLVEPKARGLGLGTRLVEECIRFARRAGYRKVVLWTNDVLDKARRIYRKAGFTIVAREAHHSFGHDLTGETWELPL